MHQISYTHVLGNKPGQRIGVVHYLESGYYLTNLDNPSDTHEQVKNAVAILNTYRGIEPEVAEAMTVGSLFGWRVPGAAKALEFFGAPELDAPIEKAKLEYADEPVTTLEDLIDAPVQPKATEWGGYAISIVTRASDYDALEVHGVRDLMPEQMGNHYNAEKHGTCCEQDDDDPQFWSVYAHLVDGGVECIGDFETPQDANQYADECSAFYGWPVAHRWVDAAPLPRLQTTE